MYETIIRLLADGLVLPIILIGAWALIFRIRRGEHYAAYCRILLAGLTAYVFAKLIASVFQPELERPFEQLEVAAGASYLNNPGFPSDHILFCTAITLAVWFETRNRSIALLLAGLTLLVAVGRVAALVHSPLDVIGGALIACLGAVWYLQRERPVRPTVKRHWSKPKNSGTIS